MKDFFFEGGDNTPLCHDTGGRYKVPDIPIMFPLSFFSESYPFLLKLTNLNENNT